MQPNLDQNIMSSTNNDNNNPTVVKTDVGAKDGQEKCPKCGSTDISTNINSGKLRCNFCRHEFEPEKVSGMVSDISTLEGQEFANNIGAKFLETSAKEKAPGLEEFITNLVEQYSKKFFFEQKTEPIQLSVNQANRKKKKCC